MTAVVSFPSSTIVLPPQTTPFVPPAGCLPTPVCQSQGCSLLDRVETTTAGLRPECHPPGWVELVDAQQTATIATDVFRSGYLGSACPVDWSVACTRIQSISDVSDETPFAIQVCCPNNYACDSTSARCLSTMTLPATYWTASVVHWSNEGTDTSSTTYLSTSITAMTSSSLPPVVYVPALPLNTESVPSTSTTDSMSDTSTLPTTSDAEPTTFPPSTPTPVGADPVQDADQPVASTKALSIGQILGVFLGTAGLVMLVAGTGLFFWWRRWKQKYAIPPYKKPSSTYTSPPRIPPEARPPQTPTSNVARRLFLLSPPANANIHGSNPAFV